MNAPAYALELEAEHVDHGSLPERSLWCAALSLLLDDARRFHQTGNDPQGAIDGTGRRALRDLLECGPMVRHLCEYTDQDAAWVCGKFSRSISVEPIGSIEQKPGDGLSDGKHSI